MDLVHENLVNIQGGKVTTVLVRIFMNKSLLQGGHGILNQYSWMSAIPKK